MRYKFGKVVVIALGGSIIYHSVNPKSKNLTHSKLDLKFLENFNKFLRKFLKKGNSAEGGSASGRKFIIVVGGGRPARILQEAAAMLSKISDTDKDWIGIHATRLNAQVLGSIFRDVSDPVIFDCRHKTNKLKYPITVASGWRPGWSTDYVSVALAYDFRVGEVIVAGKPAFVYKENPNRHPRSKPYDKITWSEYRKLIPKKWQPGFHAPVDPVAARLAAKEKVRAIVINGKDLKNFENLLRGKEFKGTVII